MRKAVLIGIMIVAIASPAWCGACRVYEYAEIKDMTDSELQIEIDTTNKLVISELQHGNELAALSAYRQSDALYESSKICQVQNDRLWAVKKKRPSYAPPKHTYGECIEISKQLNMTLDNCDKYRPTSEK
jgi:hypothetical protein